jgi:hypothetical protein
MKRYTLHYISLLKEFYNETKQYGTIYIPGLFLPNIMNGYSESELKIFYVGQDTYGWTDYGEMLQYFSNADYEGYINENNGWLTENRIIENSNNKSGSFWTLVIRLHLKLHKSDLQNVNEINRKDIHILNDLGWSNLNSIEKPSSLINEGIWDDINQEIYWKIKEASRKFDSIKHVLDIFEPHYLFIFNWDDNKEDDAFDGLKPIWNGKEAIDKVIATYTFQEYRTKIIWCPHPNNLRYQAMNNDDLINEICKRL